MFQHFLKYLRKIHKFSTKTNAQEKFEASHPSLTGSPRPTNTTWSLSETSHDRDLRSSLPASPLTHNLVKKKRWLLFIREAQNRFIHDSDKKRRQSDAHSPRSSVLKEREKQKERFLQVVTLRVYLPTNLLFSNVQNEIKRMFASAQLYLWNCTCELMNFTTS